MAQQTSSLLRKASNRNEQQLCKLGLLALQKVTGVLYYGTKESSQKSESCVEFCIPRYCSKALTVSKHGDKNTIVCSTYLIKIIMVYQEPHLVRLVSVPMQCSRTIYP